MKDWETSIGELVRETYKRQGYKDVLIMIGGIDKNNDIATQVFYPFDTAGDFDIRLMTFHLMSHLFGEYNEALEDAKSEE